jgi:hypothetical protein
VTLEVGEGAGRIHRDPDRRRRACRRRPSPPASGHLEAGGLDASQVAAASERRPAPLDPACSAVTERRVGPPQRVIRRIAEHRDLPAGRHAFVQSRDVAAHRPHSGFEAGVGRDDRPLERGVTE